MAKFSKNVLKILFNEIDYLITENIDGYYTLGIENLIKKNVEVGCQVTNGLSWMDIDEEGEFEESQKIFHDGGDLS